MKKRILSMLLVLVLALALFPTAAFAASSEEEALGEINIFDGGTELSYLSINGRVRDLIYTYYNYTDSNGRTKEIPAYCVNPNIKGVPQTVAVGESIKYLAEEKTSDPKVLGIVANGYPTLDLWELKLNDKYEAYYATKMALWTYLLGHWDINNMKVNPALKGEELERAQAVLAATKDIYRRGTNWNELLEPNITCTPDRSVAYDVTINGQQYQQQIFTFWSKTWVCDYHVSVSFTDPASVPAGTKIVDMQNNEITALKTEATGDGYGAQFKVIYPKSAIAGTNGSVQLSFSTNVYKYAIFYATCAEVDKYGQLQNYMVDTDPTVNKRLSTYSTYGSDEPTDLPETGLIIRKYETGTTLPLEGALFEVVGPDGDTIGLFASNGSGQVVLPLVETGNYTIYEREAPSHYLLSDEPAQNVTVDYGEVAEVVFYNDPYGSLRVEKKSDTGENLPGAVVQVKHIESGKVYTQTTNSAGTAIFSPVKPGAYEVLELSSPIGWELNDTVYTTNVLPGETTTQVLINKELPGLRIVKYDRLNHRNLANVTFEIWHDGALYGEYTTDEFGEILITNAEPGTWWASESDTGNPAYILDTTPQQIELKSGDGIRELVFFNDLKPGVHISKVDSNDPSKGIPGAVFEVKAVDGSYGPKEFVTTADGSIDLSMLPVGSYVITEKSCEGYIIDEAQRIIHLDPNENAEHVFTNTIKPTLRIIKLSADGTPLEGVAFRIAYVEDGTRYLDRVTNSSGIIEITDMDLGVLSIKETSTVSTHILDPREYHVQLFPGKTSELVVENQVRPNLTIWKFDADDPSKPVPGATFLVEYADGHSIAEVTTGPDGSATVENLLPSVIKITEKSVPSPYLLDAEPQLATLYPNRDRDVYFYNHKAPTITIIKECSITGNRLENVRFQVWYASNNTSDGEYRNLGVFTTDENGEIHLSRAEHGLQDGWFRVKELEAPKGFGIKDSDTQEAFVQSGKNKTFLFQNTPLSSIVIWKYDSENSQPIEGARFQLRYLGGQSGTGGTVVGVYETSANGAIVITGLERGTYIAEEIASDDNHVIDTAPQTVFISGEDQDVVQLYFGNTPKGSVLLTKKDSRDKSPLANVEFYVTDATGAVLGDNNGKFWTDSAGCILIEGLNPGTSVVAREVRTLDNYVLDNTPQTVVVRPGRTVTLEFLNAKKGNLIIQKYGVKGSEKVPLEGVEFKITYADGKVVDAENGQLSSNGIYHSNAQGQVVLSGIVGTVIVTETSSVPGFSIAENPSQTVVINSGDDTQTLYFYNQAIGGVEIIKVSSKDNTTRIPNTTFEIRRAGDDALIDTVTTGKTGSAFLALEDGSYYCLETEAAKGFRLNSERHYFSITNGSHEIVRVKNDPISGLIIHKVSSVDGSGIPNISFIIYDSNHNPIDQVTTDQSGYAYVDDLGITGKVYLRELEAEGYILDTALKTVYLRAGETTEITWKNTPITGQIQIWKKSADDNPINGFPAGTALEGAVFEIYNKANRLVDTVESNHRGLAVSKPLPLGRYTVKEVSSPSFYSVNGEEVTVYLEHEGQIVQIEFLNESVYTNASVSKTGYTEVVPGQSILYTFKDIANNSTVSLGNFYWRDTLPTDAVRLDKIITGTWSAKLNYRVVFKTNINSNYRTLADNLSTAKNNTLDASPAALGLASNEYITEFMFVFGTVPAGFTQLQTPYVYCDVLPGLSHEYRFTNKTDVGGMWRSQWIMANDRWVTIVYNKNTAPTLPRTGY